MEKKFTRAMLCEEFGSKCKECPLHSDNNPKSLPCWLLDESDIQSIMKDYPYADVKARMMFNDIETRLTEVEKKDELRVSKGSVAYDLKNNSIASFEPERIIFGDYSVDVVDKKLYDKLEAKHEADCRLISEYDLENKKLEKSCKDLYVELNNEQRERLNCEFIIKGLIFNLEKAKSWEKRHKELESLYEKKLEENSRLKKDYDALLSTMNSLQKNNKYKDLFHSLNHKHQKVVGEMKYWKERYECLNDVWMKKHYNKLIKENKILTESNNNHATDNIELEGKLEEKALRIAALEEKVRNQRANLTSLEQKIKETEEKLNDARAFNKMREGVYYANIKLQKTIEAKDREINLLRSELDKYVNNEDNDYDDGCID